MSTYTDAITAAGRALHLGRIERDSLPPRAAAEAAHEPGGISLDERERLIRTHRGLEVVAA